MTIENNNTRRLSDYNKSDPSILPILLFVLFLLVLRISGLFNVYFFEEDELSIAAGVASLITDDHIGAIYRYTPQLGYYRLIEFITTLFGSNVSYIPAIMKYLSALMGVLIPSLALFVFRKSLSEGVRWLSAFILVANPIIWKSSQYGNSAMVAAGFAFFALVLLSNQPKIHIEVFSLVVFGAAIFIRADTVLLIPLVIYLLYNNRRSFRASIIPTVVLGIILLTIYGLLFMFDPRLDNANSSVSAHFGLLRDTLFWEHFIWAISPISIIFAVLGLRKLMDKQPLLLVALFLWAIPPMLFYFSSTTTPRYFLLTVMPISIAIAVGIKDIISWLHPKIGPKLAWFSVIVVAFIHLIVGLGHFQPGLIFTRKPSPLRGPTYRTDDGQMPTGALLYDAYFRRGFLFQSFRNPGFGKSDIPYWEGLVIPETIKILSSKQHSDHTTIFLLEEGLWHAFHYHAQAEGFEYISRAPSNPSNPFSSETWWKIGSSRIMTIGSKGKYYTALNKFKVKAGDEIWFLGSRSFPDKASQNKLPDGMSLVSVKSFHPILKIFVVKEELK